jgi:hypothetical protein
MEKVVLVPVSPKELEWLAQRDTWNKRREWANQVLALVKSRPNEWLKLEGKHIAGRATRYLKPLGIKYTMDTTKYKKPTEVVLFVKWETK